MDRRIKTTLYAAVIASLYVAVSLLPGISAVSYGLVQFRFAEAFMLLCLFSPAGIAGVTVGCLLTNLFSPLGPNIYDVIFGTLATLLAGSATYFFRCYFLRHKWLAPLPTIIFNGLIVGSYLPVILTGQAVAAWLCIISVAFGEAVVCYAVGIPLAVLFEKYNLMKNL